MRGVRLYSRTRSSTSEEPGRRRTPCMPCTVVVAGRQQQELNPIESSSISLPASPKHHMFVSLCLKSKPVLPLGACTSHDQSLHAGPATT